MQHRLLAPFGRWRSRFFEIATWICCALCLSGTVSLGQGNAFVKEVISREFTVNVGGIQDPQYSGVRELISREVSLYVENGPEPSNAEIISREVSLLISSDEIPPPVTSLDVTISPTGETAYLDWSSYNQWAVGDVAGFKIYVTSTGPFSDVGDLAGDSNAQVFDVPGGTTNFEINGLTAWTDHYFAVVPYDGQPGVNSNPLVNYAASYVISPEVISREVGLFVGAEPTPPYKDIVSREISLSVVSTDAPPPITEFSVISSPIGDSAILNWIAYNQWAVGDIDHFKIYVTATGPISDVDSIGDPNLRIIEVPGGETEFEVTGLTAYTDHYFAIVAVDGLGNYDPVVNYGASYVISPEIISREVSLFVGGDRADPHHEVISREYSILVPDQNVPAPVTGIGSGFSVTTSTDEFGGVELNWSSYNEEAQLDVVRYHVYVANAFFDSVAGLTPVAYFPAGRQIQTLAGLGGNEVLHFAVVAEDGLGNFDPSVRSFSALTSVDGVGEVQNLSVISNSDSLEFSWVPPIEGEGFLEGFRIYFSDNPASIDLGPDELGWIATGLSAGAGYPFRITTIDSFGKESNGRTLVGATLLANPVNLTMRPDGLRVLLEWNAAQPSALVSHYEIFQSASPISDVSGLVPFATRTSNSFAFADFASAVGNHYAVAAVNLSAGRSDIVTSIPGIADSEAPDILSVTLRGNVLSNGEVISQGGLLEAQVTDEWGISEVEFALVAGGGAETILGADTVSSDGSSASLNLATVADGDYDLRVRATDVFGNVSSLEVMVTVALNPPTPPTITSPNSPLSTQSTSIAFFGTAPPFADVYLFEDGVEVEGPLPLNQSGVFGISVPVSFGEHVFTARARNRAGESGDSNAVTIAKRPPLTLTLDMPTVEEGGSVTGTVSTTQNVTTDLSISLGSNRPSQLALAGAVVIPAGFNSAPFEFTAVQDELIEATYAATITANAPGAIGDEISLVVGDDDWPILELSVNTTSIGESSAPGDLIAHLSRDPVTSQGLTVTLLSGDVSELESVEVEIPSGVASVNVPLSPVDDDEVDGAQSVSLTAELKIGSEFETSNVVTIEVTDDEGPVLELTADEELLREGDSRTLTVKRTGAADLNGELEIAIASENPDRMIAPATITIPDGADEISFSVTSPDDGVADGSEWLTLTASAPTYSTALKKILVTDEGLPELTPSNLLIPDAAETDEFFDLTYSIKNTGLSEIGSDFTQRIYFSADPVAGGDILVDQVIYPAGDPAIDATLDVTSSIRAPSGRGEYWIVVETDFGNAVPEINEENNVIVSKAPLVVGPAYDVTFSVDGDTFPADTPVPMSGTATRTNGDPAENVTVAIYIRKGPTERILLALTDDTGAFSTEWRALPGEGGVFDAGAAHPGDDPMTVVSTDAFEILTVEPSFSRTPTVFEEGSGATVSGTIYNPGTVLLTGLQIRALNLPSGISVIPEIAGGLTELAAGATAGVQLSFTASAGVHGNFPIQLEIITNEGVIIPITIPITVKPLVPVLRIDPSRLDCSVLRGGQKVGSFKITNEGGAETGLLEVVMPGLGWLSPVSPTGLPSLAPGETVDFSFLLNPGEATPLTLFSGNFVVRAENANGDSSVPFDFRVVSDGKGDLEIEVVDEFFFFSELKPKVEGARIVVRDAVSGEEVATTTTDASGTHLFEDLMEGWYQVEVHSPDHTNVKGNYFVNAGEVNQRQIFLSRELVKYTWTVEEIEIEDRYKVTVETTFQTNVPAPVVTVSPGVLDLGDLTEVGQQKVVNFTIENHGLIAADNVTLYFGDHPYYRFHALVSTIGRMAGKSAITIPVVIDRVVEAPEFFIAEGLQETGEIELSGTVPCGIVAGTSYSFICGDGEIFRSAPVAVVGVDGECRGKQPHPVTRGPTDPRRVDSVFHTYVYRSTADPCFGICVIKAIVGCGLGLVPGPAGCVYSMGNCAISAADGLTGIDALGCISAGIGCAPGGVIISCPFDLVLCLYDAGMLGSSSGAGGFSAPPETNRLSYPPEIASVAPELAAALERIRAIDSFYGYVLGVDGELLTHLDSGYKSFYESLAPAIQSGGIGGVSISLSEETEILNTIDSGLDGNKVIDVIRRWNRTVEYWEAGYGSSDDVPNGLNTDFIERDSFRALAANLATAFEESQNLGFADPFREIDSLIAKYYTDRGGVCAEVKIRLDQEAVMTRSAFRATLDLENNQPNTPLTEVNFDLDVRTLDGTPADEHFNIRVTDLMGLSAIDGTDAIAAASSGSAQWTLIPRDTAAPATETVYTVGGTIRYSQDGNAISIPVADVPITVRPDAALTLKYFHQRDVIADDPHTDPIEASVPYALGVMAKNDGAGPANNLRITSGQPEIVENEKGLLIDFSILGSQVEGQPSSPSLTVDLGTVDAGETKIATWLLSSSLQGLFTEYSATFEHIDGLGDPKISLLKEVEIHETVRVFRALAGYEDGRPDFLVNDVPDPRDLPDAVHLSDGTTEPVTIVEAASISGTLAGSNPVLTIDAGARAGWTYLRIPDPGDGDWTLSRVVRSDGLELPLPLDVSPVDGGFAGLGNAWVSDRTFVGLGQKPIRENILHLIDADTTGSYNFHYVPYTAPVDTTPPSSEVEMLPDESGTFFQVSWSGSDNLALAYFDIYVSIDGGDWQLWMEATTLRSATYLGDPNRDYAFYSVATDTAGNTETPPGIPDAETSSNLLNNPPLIDPISDLSIEEGGNLRIQVSASDPDGDDAALDYRILSAEPGLVIDSETGTISWATGETDGGKSVEATIRVTDSGYPASFSEDVVTIDVVENNLAPVLAPISSGNVAVGGLFLKTARAEDQDFPEQPITYSLEVFPEGMTIDSASGLISWVPTAYNADQNYTVTVSAFDGGLSNATSSTSFSVSVGTREALIPTDFVSWSLEKGIVAERIFELQDDEGDGANLLLEYAFELDPNFADYRIHDPATPSAGLPKVSLQSGKLVIEYMRRVTDSDLRYFTEFGSELESGEVTFDSNGSVLAIEAVGTDWERVTVEDELSTTTALRRFGRVRVALVED